MVNKTQITKVTFYFTLKAPEPATNHHISINLYTNIFSIRVVDLWNYLDQDVINSNNVDNFKKKLDDFLKSRGLIQVINFLAPANGVLCTLLAQC